jgi:hypothetical protein
MRGHQQYMNTCQQEEKIIFEREKVRIIISIPRYGVSKNLNIMRKEDVIIDSYTYDRQTLKLIRKEHFLQIALRTHSLLDLSRMRII